MSNYSKSMAVIAVLAVLLFMCPMAGSAQSGGGGARERIAGSANQPAEVTIIFSEAFMNAFFDAVFVNLRKPSYQLSLTEEIKGAGSPDRRAAHAVQSDPCPSQIVLEPEVAGVKTQIHFRDGRIEAPLAFSGSYSVTFVGCVSFTGWADATVALSFDQGKQSLTGRITVNDVHLSGVPNLTNGVVTRYVQSSLDQKINPVEILHAEQLSALIPVKPAGGSIRLRARGIRTEVVPGELRLHIDYEFVKG